MSQSDQVVYLNRDPKSFDSKLRQLLEAAKVQRMPANQWVAFIKGLASKGLKKDELEDSRILSWLSGDTPDAPRMDKAIEKADLLVALDRYATTVKEVVLGQPQYSGYHHGGANAKYLEILFIANAEVNNIEDRLEEIEFQMESFGFDMSALADDPELILRLERERAGLLKTKPNAIAPNWQHWSQAIQGKHGKNLIAHGRVTINDGLFFIEEIQSDWGQSGRVRKEFNQVRRELGEPELSWHPSVPKGPFVTDTKLWAGLVLRRLLQKAAMMPEIDRVAWIRINMKNGHRESPAAWEQAQKARQESAHQAAVARAAARGEPEPEKPTDDSDHFYTRLIPSLADSVIGKAGTKVGFTSETIDGVTYEKIPGFVMTPEVREVLKGVQPLYSAGAVLRNPRPVPDQVLARLLRDAREMVGSAAHIRFVDRLYNLKDMTPVAGSCMNRIMQVALNAADIDAAMNHECYHFAHENLLSGSQRKIVLDSFAPGSELNARVRDLLLRSNLGGAAAQCSDAEEAAAHGFVLYRRGQLDMSEAPARGIFDQIVEVVRSGVRWLARTAKENQLQTAEDVFRAISSGVLARPGQEVAADEGEEVSPVSRSGHRAT